MTESHSTIFSVSEAAKTAEPAESNDATVSKGQ